MVDWTDDYWNQIKDLMAILTGIIHNSNSYQLYLIY